MLDPRINQSLSRRWSPGGVRAANNEFAHHRHSSNAATAVAVAAFQPHRAFSPLPATTTYKLLWAPLKYARAKERLQQVAGQSITSAEAKREWQSRARQMGSHLLKWLSYISLLRPSLVVFETARAARLTPRLRSDFLAQAGRETRRASRASRYSI